MNNFDELIKDADRFGVSIKSGAVEGGIYKVNPDGSRQKMTSKDILHLFGFTDEELNQLD